MNIILRMEKVKEIAECSICMELFLEPKMLPCIHTFCLKCLNDTSTTLNLKPGDTMPCPLCRTPFLIPEKGMAILQKNFFMEKLVEVTKISKPTDDLALCEICCEEGATNAPISTKYCVQCQQNLCSHCCDSHGRIKLTKEHKLIPMGSELKEELIKTFQTEYCEVHVKKELEMYCSDCNQAICVVCFAENHQSHRCVGIESVAMNFREKIISDLDKASSYLKPILEKKEEIAIKQSEFKTKIENVEKMIIERGNYLKNYIDKCVESLFGELASTREKGFKKFDIQKEEIELQVTSIESFDAYCKELISKGSSAEICRSFQKLHSRVEELHKIQISQTQVQATSVKLDICDVEAISENIIGSINEEDDPTDSKNSEEEDEEKLEEDMVYRRSKPGGEEYERSIKAIPSKNNSSQKTTEDCKQQ